MRVRSNNQAANQINRPCTAASVVLGVAGCMLAGAAFAFGVILQPGPASPSTTATQVTSPPYGEHSTVRPPPAPPAPPSSPPPPAPPAPVVPNYPIRFPGFEPGRPYLVTGASGEFIGGTVVMFGSRSSDFQRHYRDWYWGSYARRSELRRLYREQGYPLYYGSFGGSFGGSWGGSFSSGFWDNQPIQGRMGSDFWNLDLSQMTVLVANDPGSSTFTVDPNLLPPPVPAVQTQAPTTAPVQHPAASLSLPKQVELLIGQQRDAEAVAILTDAIAADVGVYSQALLHTFRGYLRLSMKLHELGAADLLAAVTLDPTAVFVSPPNWLRTVRSDKWQTIADELPTKARRSAGGQTAAAMRFASALLYGHFGELDRADRQLREAEAAGLSAPLAEALRKLIGPAKGAKPAATPATIPAPPMPAD